MIDGEIYALDDFPDCVFAFCERGGYKTSFYIGCYRIGREDKIAVSCSNCICGASGDSSSRLATEQERERFHRVLKENGYKWNQANKKVIRISTGDLI